MKKIINYIKVLLKEYVYLLIYLIIISIINIFNYKTITIMNYVFILLLNLHMGIKTSRISNKKGYLTGILMGIFNIFLLFILSKILKCNINLSIITYYITILITSTIGGIIGINHKTNK